MLIFLNSLLTCKIFKWRTVMRLTSVFKPLSLFEKGLEWNSNPYSSSAVQSRGWHYEYICDSSSDDLVNYVEDGIPTYITGRIQGSLF